MTPYADKDYADSYFAEAFFNDEWEDTDDNTKIRALKEATKRIDNLRFISVKASSDQENQFPRKGQAEVPEDVKKACCELALRFIQGINPEYELDGVRIVSSGISSVRSTQDPEFTPDWIVNGIPSHTAWVLLSKYIHSNQTLRMT